MKRGAKIAIGIISGMVILGGLGTIGIMKDIPALKAIAISNVQVANIKDGTYSGKYEFSRWLSEVKVIVEGGEIKTIESLSTPLTPNVSNELFHKVIREQRIDVDTVSGATATSKAYLKSIENALINED